MFELIISMLFQWYYQTSNVVLFGAEREDLVILVGHCYECENNGISPHDFECSEFVYFNRRGYHIFFECDTMDTDASRPGQGENHDWNEYYDWVDEDGPYHGEYSAFQKMGLKYRQKHGIK